MKIILIVLLLSGCSRTVTKDTSHTMCSKGYIEYCEGRQPNSIDCECIRERDLIWFQ